MSSNLNSYFAARCATFSGSAARLLREAQEAQKRLERVQGRLWDVPCAEQPHAEHRALTAAEVAFWWEVASAAPSNRACKRALLAGGEDLRRAIYNHLIHPGAALDGRLARVWVTRN